MNHINLSYELFLKLDCNVLDPFSYFQNNVGDNVLDSLCSTLHTNHEKITWLYLYKHTEEQIKRDLDEAN